MAEGVECAVSKAFTKEDDDAPVSPARRRGAPVPVPNFMTAAGVRMARAELERLLREAGDPDRIRELSDHLATAQIAAPDDRGVVGLGAAVTVEDESGKRTTYRLVGAIEADPKRNWLSWQTPIANALWGARVADSIELPRGEVKIVAIAYDPDPTDGA
jgi:transcription elongation GreA/GreB family factor